MIFNIIIIFIILWIIYIFKDFNVILADLIKFIFQNLNIYLFKLKVKK
jgi:hypothetical protein